MKMLNPFSRLSKKPSQAVKAALGKSVFSRTDTAMVGRWAMFVLGGAKRLQNVPSIARRDAIDSTCSKICQICLVSVGCCPVWLL